MSDNLEPAADAAVTEETTPLEGATPPTPARDEDPEQSARDILREVNQPTPQAEEGRDPLLQSEDGDDPLLAIVNAEDELEVETEEADASTGETADTTEAETTESDEAEPEQKPPTQEAHGRKRVNIYRKREDGSYVHSDQDRAILALADDEGISLSEARERILGKSDPSAEAGEDSTQEAEQTTTTDPVAEIKTQIAEKKAAIRKAREDLDTDTEDALEEELADLRKQEIRIELQVEAAKQQQVNEQAQSQASLEAESVERAAQAFPDSVVPGTELHSAITADVERISKLNPQFFEDQEWPETLAAKHAMRLGIARQTEQKPETKAVPAKPVVAPVAPKKPSRPVAPAIGGGQSTASTANDADTFSARLAKAKESGDAEEVSKLLREASGKQS